MQSFIRSYKLSLQDHKEIWELTKHTSIEDFQHQQHKTKKLYNQDVGITHYLKQKVRNDNEIKK